MKPFHESMAEYREQMQKGAIREAYKGLMDYIMGLRTYFKNNYPDYVVSGGLYYGYMDMTYFSFFPASLKRKKLKIAVVFIHQTCRFEVWLAGNNKQVQSKYWNMFKKSGWKKYPIPGTITGVDSILEFVVVEHPDFCNLEKVTTQIENGTMKFIRDVEEFLLKHEP